MRIGTQKVLFDSGSFVLGIAPIAGAVLTSSIIDCSDWNSATVFVSCSSVSPTSQIEARSFISPVVSGAFYAVTGSGEQEQSTVGLTDAFSFSIDLAGARRFYVEFEEVGDPTTATQVTGSTIISHERGMRETVISSSVSGMTNPMTTLGDLIRGGASGTPERIAAGSEGSLLTTVAGIPVWQAPVTVSDRTQVSLASGSGWTATLGTGASGSVNTSTEQLDFSVPSGGAPPNLYSLLTRTTPVDSVAVDVRCRVASWDDGSTHSANDFVEMLLINATPEFFGVRITGTETVIARRTTTNFSPVSATGILGGNGWLRLLVVGTTATTYFGIGTGGASPTSWTPVYSMRLASDNSLPLSTLRFSTERAVAGTNTLLVSIDGISVQPVVAV